MSKVIFEFDGVEENDEVKFVAERFTIRSCLYELENYLRNLRKYEERNQLPTEEVEEKIYNLMEEAFKVID